MGVLTRMHFQAIARILGKNHASKALIRDFMNYLEIQNPNFNRIIFETTVERISEEFTDDDRSRDGEWFSRNDEEISPGLWIDKKTIFERIKELEENNNG